MATSDMKVPNRDSKGFSWRRGPQLAPPNPLEARATNNLTPKGIKTLLACSQEGAK